MALVFDLETDGLLPEVTKIHIICTYDTDTRQSTDYIPGHIEEGIHAILNFPGVIVGHNILKYDLEVIRKLYPKLPKPIGVVRDTKLLSTLLWPNLKELDFAYAKKHPDYPKQLIGRHSLKAWGYRLGERKGEYTGGWESFNPEMLGYCRQDIITTTALWAKVLSKNFSEQSIELEHEFQKTIMLMEEHGFPFDKAKAIELYTTLSKRRLELEEELAKVFPPWEIRTPFTPKVNNKARGYVKGVPCEKVVSVTFNPGSRDHCSARLIATRGWRPTLYGKDGKPTLDEDVLASLPYPEAKTLQEYFGLQKLLGQLGEGNQAWIKHERNGRIYGEINTNIISGRCSHKAPNVAQVPGCDSKYGKECRALFTAPPGWSLVGTDAEGVQLRALAHFLFPYDGGAYRDIVLSGDPHTANQKAAGLPTRHIAKTWVYTWLMGGGHELLGSYVGKGRAEGVRMDRDFQKNIPAIGAFRRDVDKRARERGYLIGLDKRHIPVRSAHACVSFLLQNLEAVVMKRAMNELLKSLTGQGLLHGSDWAFCAMVHDEIQVGCKPELADLVGKLAVQSINQSGEYWHVRCRLDGKYSVGKNWEETH